KRDATPPTLMPSTMPASPAASGWYNIATGAPAIAFVCQDNLSGLDGLCPAGVTLGEGANQSVSRTIHDQAGNPASLTVSNLSVDLTAPTITGTATPGSPAASGWYNVATGAPTVTFLCQDATSGGPGPVSCLPTSGTQFALGNTTVTCHDNDVAGNPATATTFVVHVVDTIAPVIVCGSADGLWHASNVSVACTASDSGSGLANASD